MIRPQVVEALANLVGRRWIRTAPTELETFAADGLPTKHSVPGAVVFPGSHDEVVGILEILAHHEVPFAPRGAGTGLSGGALADRHTVNIVLTRLNRILEVDAVNRLARVEPGVVNVRLSQAAAPHGLQYAPDPSSQTACTIGGNVAENAGGPHCFKYGVTSNHILELQVVQPDATVVTLGAASGEMWGPDLVGLFVGSEGMFGIATRITVRLVPAAPVIHTLLADFDALRRAGEAVSAIVASGLVPAALEMMDQNCIRAVEASIYAAGYPTSAAAILLVELDGQDDTVVAAEAEAVRALLTEHGAGEIRTATAAAERARLWHGRKKAFGAMGRINTDLVVQDAVVPRSALPDVLEEVSAIAARYDLSLSNVFHAGDGNLHPNISFNRHNADEADRVERASSEIMAACIRAGGSITGEHGVGSDKIRYMEDIFDQETLGAMRALRRSFDPAERANPNKVLPLHACREWWATSRARAAT